jgi:hypothetical protein
LILSNSAGPFPEKAANGAVVLEKNNNYRKNSDKYKVALLAVVLVFVCVIAATYKSARRSVTRFFNADKAKIAAADGKLAAAVSDYYAGQPDFAEYAAFLDADFIGEILKNADLNIISVSETQSETVVAVVEISALNIDKALDVYFDETIKSAVLSTFANESKTRGERLAEKIGLTLETSDSEQNFETKTFEFEFMKSEGKWLPKDPGEFYGEYYGALTNGIFLKINDFWNYEAPEVFLRAFLESLKTESSKFFAAENSNVSQIISLFYNNVGFEILNAQISETRASDFETAFYVYDAAIFFKYVENRMVEFFKTRNDAKQTPTGAEMNEKYAELIIESFEVNKENRAKKQIPIRVSQSFEIVNAREFFGELVLDFYAERNNCAGNIEKRIENLYKN